MSHNPMGVAAMTLAGGQYAIHGTNVPGSVGRFASACTMPTSPTSIGGFRSARRLWWRT